MRGIKNRIPFSLTLSTFSVYSAPAFASSGTPIQWFAGSLLMGLIGGGIFLSVFFVINVLVKKYLNVTIPSSLPLILMLLLVALPIFPFDALGFIMFCGITLGGILPFSIFHAVCRKHFENNDINS